jgi:transcriptional regulator with XRE-family HTH domain
MDIDKIATLKALGFLVRKQREKLNISQEELATRSDLDRTYISGIERGVRNPSLTAILSLANGLGINTSDLLENLESQIKKIK